MEEAELKGQKYELITGETSVLVCGAARVYDTNLYYS